MNIHICIGLLLTIVILSPAQNRIRESIPDPHHHVVNVHEGPWQSDIASEARISLLLAPVHDSRDSVLSPNSKWIAFIFSTEDEWARIGFEDTQTGKRFQIIGLPLPHRPINDLVWIDSTLIAFDRWSQPHYGIHYVVDVRKRQLLLAAPFPDEFFLRQQHDSLRWFDSVAPNHFKKERVK